MSKSNNISEYSQRVVAFIDVLGFKKIINDSLKNEEIIKKILYVLDEFKKFQSKACPYECKFCFDRYITDRKMTLFSDTLVISCDVKNIEHIIREIIFIQIKLLASGILIRGGISKGLMYHNEQKAFGPAFIKAYELESKRAIYPRIIIDGTLQLELNLFAEDFDGFLFIDYLRWYTFWENIFPKDTLVKILDFVNAEYEQLNKTNDIEIYPKLAWLKYYIYQTFEIKNNEVILLRKGDHSKFIRTIKP